ncbi:MAG: YhjD/YihY/BrkB family envelope integrity protein [Pseudomonadota bacterium]
MILSRIKTFLQTDLWRVRRRDLPWPRSIFVMILRTAVLTMRGRAEHRIDLAACGLTYYSLVAVVPALALVFGVGQGFGFQKAVEKDLLDRFPGQEEAVAKVVGFARAVLENVQGGLIAGIGFIILFLAIYRVLSQTETTFNHIWGIGKSRTWARRATDYLAVMIFFPIFLVMSGTVTVFIAGEVSGFAERIYLLGAVGPLITLALTLAPFLMMWLLFTVLYIFLPNGKVEFIPGLIAGIAAGTVFQLFQKFYISSQLFISRYNAVYGSFAALPLFLLWLEISWLIVLFGAEACCAMQNLDSHEWGPGRERAGHAYRRETMLQVAHLLVKKFSRGEKSPTSAETARELGMPKTVVLGILDELISAGVVSRTTAGGDWNFTYQPAQDPDLLTIARVVEAWENAGDERRGADAGESGGLKEYWEMLAAQVRQSPANKKLKDI